MINIDLNQNPIEEVIDSLSNLKIENIDFTNLIKELENYKKIYNIVKSNRDFLEHFIYKNRDYIIYLCIKNDGKSLYLKNYMCDKIDEESKNKVLKIWFAGGEKVKLDWNNFIYLIFVKKMISFLNILVKKIKSN